MSNELVANPQFAQLPPEQQERLKQMYAAATEKGGDSFPSVATIKPANGIEGIQDGNFVVQIKQKTDNGFEKQYKDLGSNPILKLLMVKNKYAYYSNEQKKNLVETTEFDGFFENTRLSVITANGVEHRDISFPEFKELKKTKWIAQSDIPGEAPKSKLKLGYVAYFLIEEFKGQPVPPLMCKMYVSSAGYTGGRGYNFEDPNTTALKAIENYCHDNDLATFDVKVQLGAERLHNEATKKDYYKTHFNNAGQDPNNLQALMAYADLKDSLDTIERAMLDSIQKKAQAPAQLPPQNIQQPEVPQIKYENQPIPTPFDPPATAPIGTVQHRGRGIEAVRNETTAPHTVSPSPVQAQPVNTFFQ